MLRTSAERVTELSKQTEYETMLKAYYHDLTVLTDQILNMEEQIERGEVRKLRNIEQEQFFHKFKVYQEMRLDVVSSIDAIENIINRKGEQNNDKHYHNHRKGYGKTGSKIS